MAVTRVKRSDSCEKADAGAEDVQSVEDREMRQKRCGYRQQDARFGKWV